MKKGETRASGDPGKIPPFGDYEAIQKQLKALKGPKGVIQDGAGKVSPTLTSPEVARYKNIFGILKEVLFPGPEARKVDTSDKAVDKMPQLAQQVAKSKVPTAKGGFGWLKGALGLLATGIATWIASMMDEFQQWGLKTLLKAKTWFKPVLKLFGRVVDFFGDMFGAIKKSKVGKMFSKMLRGGRSIFSVIKKAIQPMVRTLGKFGRFLPVVGSIFSFGFAIEKFRKGDYVGAMLELASGILNILPTGVGNAASMVIDGYILFREFQEYGEGEKGTWSGEGKMLMGVWDKLKGWFGENAHKLPIIGGIIKWGEAAKHLLAGNWKEGIRAFAQVMPAWIAGGIGAEYAGKGFDFVYGILSGDHNIDYDSVTPNFDGSEFADMIGNMFTAVGDVLGNIFTGMYNFVSDWATAVVTNLSDTVKNVAPNILSAVIPGLGVTSAVYEKYFKDGGSGDSGKGSEKNNVTAGGNLRILSEMKGLDVERNIQLLNIRGVLERIEAKLGATPDIYPTELVDPNLGHILNAPPTQ